jgi:hypothetical protein
MLGVVYWKYFPIGSDRSWFCSNDYIFSVASKYLIIAEIILLIATFYVADFIVRVEV